MTELEMHNFIVSNEIIDSNNNHQLMKPTDKRLVNYIMKGSSFMSHKHEHTHTNTKSYSSYPRSL